MNAVRWLTRNIGWRGRLQSTAGRVAMVTLLVLSTGRIAGAAIEAPSGAAAPPIRLGFVEGDVLFWRPGSGDWEAARKNIPLAAGDALATRNGKLEMQIARQSFFRAADGTELELKSNEPGFLQVAVSGGSVVVDARELHAQAIEIDTPNATVGIQRDGFYRVDFASESTRVVVRRGGEASVTAMGGTVTVVASGEAADITGNPTGESTTSAAPPFDEWDRWNYARADQYLAAPRSNAVSADIYGTEDLEQYGSWRYSGTYGRVWAPYSVPAGWSPYSDGRWLWDPFYGWSWVDYSPWGWAPFHYGRWVYAGYWGWAPGPALAVPFYSPALVAFFGGPGFSIGIGVPFVSWVGLGWGEPLIPWWGGVGFIGVPCWNGWGGPHVVNNVVINNNTVINANTVNIYRNAQVAGGMVGVPKNQFDTRSLDRVRLQNVSTNNLTPIHGQLPVTSKTAAGAAPSKMPMPDLNGQRQLTSASNGSANFARQSSQALGAQRAGTSGLQDGTKTTSNAALDALRRGGPGALTEPRSGQSGSATQSADLRRGNVPPVPNGAKGAGVDALHGAAPSGQGATAASTGAANFGRTTGQPAVSADGSKPVSGAFNSLRTAPPPLPGGSKGGATQALRAAPSSVGAANFGRTTGQPPVSTSSNKPVSGAFNSLRTTPPPLPGGSKGGMTQALRGAPSSTGAAVTSPPASNFQRAPVPFNAGKPAAGTGSFNGLRSAPPPVPSGPRGAAADGLRRNAPTVSTFGSSASSNFTRAQQAPPLPAVGKPGSAAMFGRSASSNFGRTQQPPQLPAAGTYSRLRTQPFSPQVQRGGGSMPDMRRYGSGGGSPAAVQTRRFASIDRQPEQRGAVQRPSMPSMNAFRAQSGRAAAPAPQASMPSFSRGGGGTFSRPSGGSFGGFGGSHGGGGGFSHGGITGGGRSMAGVMGGGKFGH